MKSAATFTLTTKALIYTGLSLTSSSVSATSQILNGQKITLPSAINGLKGAGTLHMRVWLD